MTPGRGIEARVDAFCAEAEERFGGDRGLEVRAVRDRLIGPLRVAVAGRVKAGKSTLLNALVGERIAATDAAECTKIVTWYRHGESYDVHAFGQDGSERPVEFATEDGILHIDLQGQPPELVEWIDVTWPSSKLQDQALIDTPGLGSVSADVSERTLEFFAFDEDRPGAADVVLYLMRHAHQTDADFLDAFRDAWVVGTSPVNAIGVLSRADEVGAGRPDAMQSATAVAARYAKGDQLSFLVNDVVAVAGLLAETAATLREQEFAWLRDLAGEHSDVRASMLISVDRFRDPGATNLTVEIREELLRRLGMYGLRIGLEAVRSGEASTAVELAAFLRRTSGIERLEELIQTNFADRAGRLKARSAMVALRGILRDAGSSVPTELLRGLEQLQSDTHELAELWALHMVATGIADVDEATRAECHRLFSDASVFQRLGVHQGADRDMTVAQAKEGAVRWRERGANPLVSRDVAYVSDVAARSYEGIFATLD